jgi:hypothetical protein
MSGPFTTDADEAFNRWAQAQAEALGLLNATTRQELPEPSPAPPLRLGFLSRLARRNHGDANA